MTTKLYWQDSHLTGFSARVTAMLQDNLVVVLDRTAFYPVGGGQPNDLGTIATARVKDVTMQDDGTILHHLEEAADFVAGQEIVCQIDAARRLELTQQHTGQHLLSQAFFQLFGAETHGFRIKPSTSEIDLALDFPAADIASALCQAEDLSNRIVFENRPIRTHIVLPDEASKLPLRKESFITDCVRVIEIEDFDWSACGGTHAAQTGEVGLIAVKGWERAKKMTRVEFVCGIRALCDYRMTNATTEAIARKFSVGKGDVIEAVHRLSEENKQLAQRVRYLAQIATKVEAEELIQNISINNGLLIVSKVFNERSFEEVKLLAHHLVKTESVLALLAVQESSLSRLVFACAANVQADMGILMREACQQLGGRGGGTSDFAQGGGSLAGVETVIATIANRLH
jgi:alanyl-tRNA synthetase